nr:hypothetical protein Iba_chr14bCG14220 [Ipomoea batatas]
MAVSIIKGLLLPQFNLELSPASTESQALAIAITSVVLPRCYGHHRRLCLLRSPPRRTSVYKWEYTMMLNC